MDAVDYLCSFHDIAGSDVQPGHVPSNIRVADYREKLIRRHHLRSDDRKMMTEIDLFSANVARGNVSFNQSRYDSKEAPNPLLH